MEYTMQQRCQRIIQDCMSIRSTNPVDIFNQIAQKDYIRIHGPEHHILDGACLLTAFANAGGNIDLGTMLSKLTVEGLRMPGATCGLWGVCGAVTSIGAALALLDNTGPLSSDGSWGEHMRFTSGALAKLADINGPRCCKRDAFVSLLTAVDYVNSRYAVNLDKTVPLCSFSPLNQQCIRERCPFYTEKDL